MLTHTFCHIPGVGPATERKLWECGLLCWQDFLQAYPEIPLSPRKSEHIRDHLERSAAALQARDHRFFAEVLSSRDCWRAFPQFADSAVYLDIETTGLGEPAEITMIGLYDGDIYRPYIKGQNLADFAHDIAAFSLIITYFGTAFDLPFILRRFPTLRLPQIHIDLCYPLRRLGYTGGLKNIEEQLGIQRSEDTHGLSGFDAVRLWREYERGNARSLDLLVRYNQEDVVNLHNLMHIAYAKLIERLGFPFA
jgi:uncharacterized protein YprB with RNaseH-like and TPR domain